MEWKIWFLPFVWDEIKRIEKFYAIIISVKHIPGKMNNILNGSFIIIIIVIICTHYFELMCGFIDL